MVEGLSHSEFHAAWNESAKRNGFTKSMDMTPKRKASHRQRWMSAFWRANWEEALGRIGGSPFCKGVNNRGWTANIQWFLRDETVAKIMEGQYDDKAAASTFLDDF